VHEAPLSFVHFFTMATQEHSEILRRFRESSIYVVIQPYNQIQEVIYMG
jgi:hypothetical protein